MKTIKLTIKDAIFIKNNAVKTKSEQGRNIYSLDKFYKYNDVTIDEFEIFANGNVENNKLVGFLKNRDIEISETAKKILF